eukprot:gene24179-29243_t
MRFSLKAFWVSWWLISICYPCTGYDNDKDRLKQQRAHVDTMMLYIKAHPKHKSNLHRSGGKIGSGVRVGLGRGDALLPDDASKVVSRDESVPIKSNPGLRGSADEGSVDAPKTVADLDPPPPPEDPVALTANAKRPPASDEKPSYPDVSSSVINKTPLSPRVDPPSQESPLQAVTVTTPTQDGRRRKQAPKPRKQAHAIDNDPLFTSPRFIPLQLRANRTRSAAGRRNHTTIVHEPQSPPSAPVKIVVATTPSTTGRISVARKVGRGKMRNRVYQQEQQLPQPPPAVTSNTIKPPSPAPLPQPQPKDKVEEEEEVPENSPSSVSDPNPPPLLPISLIKDSWFTKKSSDAAPILSPEQLID